MKNSDRWFFLVLETLGRCATTPEPRDFPCPSGRVPNFALHRLPLQAFSSNCYDWRPYQLPPRNLRIDFRRRLRVRNSVTATVPFEVWRSFAISFTLYPSI